MAQAATATAASTSTPSDPFEEASLALSETRRQPPAAAARAASPAAHGDASAAVAPPSPAEKVYPKFHAEDWHDHPIAVLVNRGADAAAMTFAGTTRGAAEDCELGEAFAFAGSYYVGLGDAAPPWMVPLVAVIMFAFVVGAAYFAKKRAARLPVGPPKEGGGGVASASAADLRARFGSGAGGAALHAPAEGLDDAGPVG